MSDSTSASLAARATVHAVAAEPVAGPPLVDFGTVADELSGRARRALRRWTNWLQFFKFCVVGGSGYVVNVAVFALAVAAGVHYVPAAVCSFLVSVTNNYLLNRRWTFGGARGQLARQGIRYLVVSTVGLGANLVLLTVFVFIGVAEVPSQAAAIVAVTPLSFLGNKLWSFR